MKNFQENAEWLYYGMLIFCFLLFSIGAVAQVEQHDGDHHSHHSEIEFDQLQMMQNLSNANSQNIELPFSIGGERSFVMVPQEIFSQRYLDQRPDVKTYKITAIEDSNISGNLMTTDQGIYASIHTSDGLVSIFPNENQKYTIERGMGDHSHEGGACTHTTLDQEYREYIKENGVPDARIDNFDNGTVRHEFKLALVCTGEYYVLNGNNDSEVANKMAAAMMGINTIFETEMAYRFAPIDIELFRNKDTDPFTPNDGGGRTDEASIGVKAAFPSGDYDIGHAFHRTEDGDGWGNGGVARLAAVCRDNDQSGGLVKAKGWSASGNTDGNGFISLAAHEFAHMFGATHTFNGEGGFNNSTTCTDAISETSAYEIGSGTTIMSYNNLCDPDQNVASSGVADNYFHVHSLFQMITFVNNNASQCATIIPLNNTPPTINANECGGDVEIPRGTPFFLKGTATDDENDNLTYCWEQYDEDGAGSPTIGLEGTAASNSFTAPLFRSFPPSQEPIRYFPQLSTIVEGNTSDPFEVLSNRERDLLFQFTVRDDHSNGGGMATDEVTVSVQNSGPLTLGNVPNITAGTESTVTWQTNGTESLCDQAKLLLSIDGGLTYPFTVASGIDYASGTASFTLSLSFPANDNARLMLACDDNTCYSFFDITNNDFSISSSCLAGVSHMCDINYEVFDQGEPALNLDLKHYDGEAIRSMSGSLNQSTPTSSVIYWNEAETNCRNAGLSVAKDYRRITVDQSGNYNFFIDLNATSGSDIITIYDADLFDPANLCAGFITSNTTSTNDNAISWSSSFNMSVELKECKEYIVAIQMILTTGATLPQNFSIPDITGPGNIIEINESPSADFSSTFIAVDENNIIEAVSPTSDFTSLSGGLYTIYSVSYKSGGDTPPDNTDPATWPGTNLDDLIFNNCLLLSSNSKEILVEFTCRINGVELGTQTACNPLDNTYSQELIITYESAPLTGNLVVNGVPFPPTGSPMTVELAGLISDGQNVGVNISFATLSSCSLFVPNLFTAPENCCEIAFDLGGDRAVCSGEDILLDAGTDGVTYRWFLNGGLLENETGQNLIVTETGNYIVEVTNDSGCSKTEVVNITIFDTPTVMLEDDKSECEGEIFNLPAETNATMVQWYKDDVLLMGETDLTLLITQAGQYHVIGSNEYLLAMDEILTCTASDTINIDYVPRPVVDLGEDQELCEDGPSVLLDAGNDGTEYSWARNSTIIANETSNQLTVTESGQYVAIVDRGGGCDATDTVNITYFDLPEVFAGNDMTICEGNTTELLTLLEGEVSFEWFYNGNLFADQSDTPEVSEGGEYVLIAYNEIECSASDTVQVQTIMPPMPDLGDDKIGCIGSEVVLGVEGVGNVFWSLNNMVISEEDTIRVTDPGTYTVTIIAGNDCNGTDEVEVTFEAGPSLTLGDNSSICEGETFTIEADTDVDAVTWFRDGEEIVGETTVMLEVSESGIYRAVVEGTSGCIVEDEITITVNEVPEVTFDGNTVICDGEMTTIIGTAGAASYQWFFNGIVISDQPMIDVDQGGDYTLTITNEFGCEDTDIIAIMENAKPTLAIESTYGLCEGGAVTITADSDGNTFQWFVDGTEITGETTNTISLNTEGEIEVIASSTDGCTTTASATVTESLAPEVSLGDDVSLCPNEDFVLAAGSHTTYSWSDGTDDATISLFSSVNELTTETYTVTVTNESGCTAEDQVEVTFLPFVEGTVSQSAAGVCNGEPVQLIASGGDSYSWIDDTGTLTDIDGPMATAMPTESTTYSVFISDDDCPGNETSEIVVIDVFEAGDDVDAGEDDCAVNGNTIDLNATGGTSYEWLDDPTIISGTSSANPTVGPTEETVYFVDITDANGCIYRDSVTICVLDDPLEFFELISIITPNGDGNNDALRFTGLESFPDNSITIYNRWGYEVYAKKGYQIDDDLWNGENGGDILPADTYYYILTFNGETYKNAITILR